MESHFRPLCRRLIADLRVLLPRNKVLNIPGQIVIVGRIPQSKQRIVKSRLETYLNESRYYPTVIVAGYNSIVIPV